MDIDNIKTENDLRVWLTQSVNEHNRKFKDKIDLQWTEPGYGSTMGVSDCNLTVRKNTFGLELKHLKVTKNGVVYKIRPVQRKYNFLGVTKDAKKLIILATIERVYFNELVIIRGDKVPMRDYASDPASRCSNGEVDQKTIKELHLPKVMQLIESKEFWNGTPVRLNV